jgi:hypothetical protein
MARHATDAVGRLLGLGFGLGLLVHGGCRLGDVPRPTTAATGAALVAPWQLPVARLGSQSLFRLRIEGPDGEGSLRLLLRLVSAERYQLLVSDRLGRAVYALDAQAGEGLLIDHQKQRVCAIGNSFELEGVPLDPIPVAAVPALLLGRVPTQPAPPDPDWPPDGEVTFTDDRGRPWSVTLAAGEPVAWSLLEAGRPALWWRRTERGFLLSDRVRGVQLSWEESVREPLAGELRPLQVPAGYATEDCR